MSSTEVPPSLLAACEAMLREVSQFPITPERLADAGVVFRDVIAAIRALDEVDLEGVEPATHFRVRP